MNRIRKVFLSLLSLPLVATAAGPSLTIPVLHISTLNEAPIDQKLVYVDATAWLDVSMCPDLTGLGSAEAPVALGIRGRGNASWLYNVKKPYKLKLAIKASPAGLTRSKHFALLHYPGSNATMFREPLGFELGRRIGLDWTPAQQPVEVVLNGAYLGMYFLTESVKVDENRVNITRQNDMEADAAAAERGWLVEIDNYTDEHQHVFTQPDGKKLRLTFKSPEVLSDVQSDYITAVFGDLIDAVYDFDSDRWTDFIDLESCARYYIVHEILHNYDAFNGSFYLHKEDGVRWTFGPLWDLSYSLDKITTTSILNDLPASNQPKLMRQILERREFRKAVRSVWADFYAEGTEWIDAEAERLGNLIAAAARHDAECWNTKSNDARSGGRTAARLLKGNIEWLNGWVMSDDFVGPSPDLPANYDEEAAQPGRLFDLSGREVRTSSARGIYIQRIGNRTVKLLR